MTRRHVARRMLWSNRPGKPSFPGLSQRPRREVRCVRRSAPAAVVPDPRSILVIFRSDARTRGAALFIPVIDSGLFGQDGSALRIALVVGLGAIAIIALLVAAAAHRSSQARRSGTSIDEEELFTTTPLPMPKEELARLAKNPPHHAYSAFRLPRWVQIGSLIVALGFTWTVAQRMRPNDGSTRTPFESRRATPGAVDRAADDANDSPEDLDLSPDSAPPFSFRARDWVAIGEGCEGRLEVTKGEAAGWNLTARVHDAQGQFLDSARTRVATLRRGDVVEFRFARTACDRIGAWDIRGDQRE